MSNDVGRPSSSLHFAVGELSGKVDNLTAVLLPQLTTIRTDLDVLNGRVRKLEIGHGSVLGGLSVVVFLVTSWEFIGHVLRK